jgi:hypothetical protein
MLARWTHPLVFAAVLALQACRSASHEPKAVTAPRPEAHPDPASQLQPQPAQDDFSLQDEPPADAAQLLQAARHDCCDEMPAVEVRAALRDAGAALEARPRAAHGQQR